MIDGQPDLSRQMGGASAMSHKAEVGMCVRTHNFRIQF